ncbi:helix-turn-helix domain-containing protein [Natronococcus wangiae]|uniref:helix-turn-helix domain-containing protein n=1 Tax=Natronococcus wangiae TaxID=3068275 RepID=UPI00273DD1F1|nr:helix-turn-helix domain-containing protein [Natronococcus sp. AD5]
MIADVPLTTVARAFEVLETVRDLGGASVSELTAELELLKSTVHDYVTTLARLGYLTNADGEYDLGLTFLTHGQYAQDELALADRVQPPLEALAEETNEIV